MRIALALLAFMTTRGFCAGGDWLAPLSPAPREIVSAIHDLAVTQRDFMARPHPLMDWFNRAGLDPSSDAHLKALAPAARRLAPGFEARAAAEYNEAGGSMSVDFSPASKELEQAIRKADAEDPALKAAIARRAGQVSQAVLEGKAGAADVDQAAQDLRLLAIYPKGSNAYLALKSLSRVMRRGSPPSRALAAARDILRMLGSDRQATILPSSGDEAPPPVSRPARRD